MATAEEILAAANGVDGQSVLVIDNDLRVIAIPDDVKLLGVESDDDVRRLYFSMPRQYGEVDLSGFAVRINYINANSEGDVYTVGDAQTDGDRITFSWLIGRHAARYAGNVQFIVCLKRFEGGEVVQEYNTTVAALPVLKGLETDEAVVQENPNVIEGILLRLSALEQGGGAGGADGGYYVPHVDTAGNLSWTASKAGMPGVAGANIKGATGDKGAKGDPGEDYVLTESDKAEIAGMVEVTLPIAGADTLGGVKPVAKTGGMTQEVGVDADGGLWTMAGGVAYPVGSVYISAVSTSPASLFGGMWEQIKDAFLLSAGDDYAAGSTGGAAEITLETANLPAHAHTRGTMDITGSLYCYSAYNKGNDDYWTNATSGAFYKDPDNYNEEGSTLNQSENADLDSCRMVSFKASRAWTGETSYVGEGEAFGSMPPYLTVYMWKRVK